MAFAAVCCSNSKMKNNFKLLNIFITQKSYENNQLVCKTVYLINIKLSQQRRGGKIKLYCQCINIKNNIKINVPKKQTLKKVGFLWKPTAFSMCHIHSNTNEENHLIKRTVEQQQCIPSQKDKQVNIQKNTKLYNVDVQYKRIAHRFTLL